MRINKEQLKKFGNRVKEKRLEKDYSQGDLARLLGRDSTTISRWENGERNPTQGDLLLLSRFLDIKIQTLQSLAGNTPEFDWLSTNFNESISEDDILDTADENEKDELRNYLLYIRFLDQVKKSSSKNTQPDPSDKTTSHQD